MIYIIVINLFLQLMNLTFRKEVAQRKKVLFRILFPTLFYNPQIEMFARFKMKSSFHKTKRII